MAKIFIKPIDGLKVKTPEGGYIKDDGQYVESSVYWRRRIRFGEVELAKEKKQDKPEPKKEKKSKKKKEVIEYDDFNNKEGE